jgi:hypothetical protein
VKNHVIFAFPDLKRILEGNIFIVLKDAKDGTVGQTTMTTTQVHKKRLKPRFMEIRVKDVAPLA